MREEGDTLWRGEEREGGAAVGLGVRRIVGTSSARVGGAANRRHLLRKGWGCGES